MKKPWRMNLIWCLIFLSSSCLSPSDCLVGYKGNVLIYDEDSCLSCRENAKEFLNQYNKIYPDVQVVVLNTKSKKKIGIEFKGIKNAQIQFLPRGKNFCFNEFPTVALLQHENNKIRLIKDFTN